MDATSKTKVLLSDVEIKPLDSSQNRAAFCCGEKSIDNFFRINSRDQHEKHRVRVYVATYKERPIGYYYLIAATHDPEHVNEEATKKYGRVKSTPCVYLGMLGVDKDHQNCGVGKLLMLHAFKTTLAVANFVGIYALTLQAINEDKAKTYERWGFKRFLADPLKMYVAVHTLHQASVSN